MTRRPVFKILLLLIFIVDVNADETLIVGSDEYVLDMARKQTRHHHGGQNFLFALADRLEYQSNEGESLIVWDAQAWYGGDINKFWLKTEGHYENENAEVEEAEIQALYSRAIASYWDLQAGLRYDNSPGPDRSHLVLGVQGLAPYWFEVDAVGFISDKGDVSFRVEVEYEILLTQRLILQPRVELNAALQDDIATGTGSGIGSIETGFRLRYEIAREFAPYIGINWARSFGDTADFRIANGEQVEQLSLVAGIRFWY